MTGRLVSRLKANAGRLVAIVLVVGVFVFVLPRVANYHEVWEIITGLSTRDMAALVLVSLLNLATFAPPWMAAFPGPLVPARPRALDGLDGGLERAARRRCRGHRPLLLDAAALGLRRRAGRGRHRRDHGLERLRERHLRRGRRGRPGRRRRVARPADDGRADRHRRADRGDRAVHARAAGRRQRDPRRPPGRAAVEPPGAAHPPARGRGLGSAAGRLPPRGHRPAAAPLAVRSRSARWPAT